MMVPIWKTTLQLDYVHPIGEHVKLETGLKSVLRDIKE